MNQKKMSVLLISNNCISTDGATGRTLKNLFHNTLNYEIHQFFVSEGIPDNDDVCTDYFYIGNKDVLKLPPFHSNNGHVVPVNPKEREAQQVSLQTSKKTVLTSLIRNFVWNLGAWKSKKFLNWLDSVSPNVILFMGTDAEFLLRIIMFVAKRYDCPIVMFNTERYYFNDTCYMYLSKGSKFLYPIWLKQYRKTYEKLMKKVSCAVYNSHLLQKKFQEKFCTPSTVLYASTDVQSRVKQHVSEAPRFVYMGNLGLRRYESLIELGKAIHKVNSKATFDVFGNANQSVIIDALTASPYVRYKGVIPYNQVKQNLYDYDFLVHVESFDPSFINDVKYGFSTKIPDCLASGTCLIAYADQSIAFMEYLVNTESACTIVNSEQLETSLREIIFNVEKRNSIINNAINIANKNHRAINNAIKLYQILLDVTKGNSQKEDT